MLASNRPPALIDVIGGQQNVTLPHAVWLRDAGVGRHLDDDVQAWFDYKLAELTGHDKVPLVSFWLMFCAGYHNAALRELDLGYISLPYREEMLAGISPRRGARGSGSGRTN